MPESTTEHIIEGLRLDSLKIQKSRLLSAAYHAQGEEEFLMGLAHALPKEGWNAEELLSFFETCDFFRAYTKELSDLQRVRLGRKFRSLVQEHLEIEAYNQALVGKTVGMDQRESLLMKLSMLNDRHLDRMLQLRATSSPPPTALTSLSIPIPRLSARMTHQAKEVIRNREALRNKLREMFGSSYDEREQNIDRMQRNLETVRETLRDMSLEMRGKTDAEFFMREMSARLRECDPQNAERLIDGIVMDVGLLAAENNVRFDTDYKKARRTDRAVFLRGLQYRYAAALQKISDAED